MIIHRRKIQGFIISIDHYRRASKNATFSIQVIEKLPRNGYGKGLKDNAMMEYQIQREVLKYIIPTEISYLFILTI